MPRLAKRLPQRVPETPVVVRQQSGIRIAPPTGDVLRWVYLLPASGKSTVVDITELADGTDAFRGRPELARELAPGLRNRYTQGGQRTKQVLITSLRSFWVFLDKIDEFNPVNNVTDLSDEVGDMYASYLLSNGLATNTARRYLEVARNTMSSARKGVDRSLPDLAWTTVQRDRGTLHKDVDPVIVRPLYRVLKSHFVEIARRFACGNVMSGVTEPSVGTLPVKLTHDHYSIIVTAAEEFIRRATNAVPPIWCEVVEECGLKRSLARTLEPGLLRCFAPGFTDTAIAFFLVLLHTGWNPETVRNIDVSATENWCDARLQETVDSKSSVAIYANKNRVGKEQIAFSLEGASHHPYQVIKKQIERTKRLRKVIIDRLHHICEGPLEDIDVINERADLIRMSKCPWLFISYKGEGAGGRICLLEGTKDLNETLRKLAKEAVQHERAKHRDYDTRFDQLLTIRPSDLRDAYAAFVYKDSAFNELALKNALNHRHLSTTRHYLRQRGQIALRFLEFQGFLESFWDEIGRFRSVDPTILYLRAKLSEITEEQRRRLSDHRQRTRMGFGCLEPYNPPAEILPGGTGSMCSVHRCTLCRHGVVFSDSLGSLAVRMAELITIRAGMPIDRFTGSTLHLEWLAIESLLRTVFLGRRREFDQVCEDHQGKLRSGRAYLFEESLDHPTRALST